MGLTWRMTRPVVKVYTKTCAPIIVPILGSILNTLGRVYVIMYRERASPLWTLITFASLFQFSTLFDNLCNSQLLTRYNNSKSELPV